MLKRIASIALLSFAGPVSWAQTPTPSPTPAPAAAAPSATPPAATAPVTPTVDAKVAGQDVPVPPRKKYVAPEYPAAAAAEGIRGIVIMEVIIAEDGRVESTRVTRSIQGLDEAAMTAVRLWEYEPTKLAGKAVKVRLSQSITFALKLPDLQRAPGVPELKSGGAPAAPAGLAAPETASVMIALGSQGEVKEAAVVEGNPAAGEGLLRAVKGWRFTVAPNAEPVVFTVRADWAPGPPPTLTLKATDARSLTAAATAPRGSAPPTSPAAQPSAPATQPPANPAQPSLPSETPAKPAASTPPSAPTPAPVAAPVAPPAPTPAATPDVDTDVIPARQEPPPREEGVSAVGDVILGENIPDLVRGRRPVWPPLARLGNVAGDVVVRFSVDLTGKVTVHSAEGPDMLKSAGEQATATWVFRRTAIDRLHLIATFKFGADRTFAKIERAPVS